MSENDYDTLVAIRAFIDTHHFGPTLEQLCGLMGWKSLATAHKKLSRLRTEGLMAPQRAGHRMSLSRSGRTLIGPGIRREQVIRFMVGLDIEDLCHLVQEIQLKRRNSSNVGRGDLHSVDSRASDQG